MKKLSLLLILIFSVTNIYAEKANTYGPIKRGELLWKIAGKISPPLINRYQAIVALHKKNPHAFSVSCNMNTLKGGAILKIPSLMEMQKYTKNEAKREVNRQNAEWNNSRSNPIHCPPIVEEPEIEELPQPVVEKKTEVEEINTIETEPNQSEIESPTPENKPESSNETVENATSNDIKPTPSLEQNTPTSDIIDEPKIPELKKDSNLDEEKPFIEANFILGILLGLGISITILIAWLLHKYAQKKTQGDVEEFTDPIDEISYHNPEKQTNNTDKSTDEK